MDSICSIQQYSVVGRKTKDEREKTKDKRPESKSQVPNFKTRKQETGNDTTADDRHYLPKTKDKRQIHHPLCRPFRPDSIVRTPSLD
ncbi:MAG: hypothetical protein WBG90_05465 [Saonia sp.]